MAVAVAGNEGWGEAVIAGWNQLTLTLSSLFSLQVNVLFGRDLNRIVRRSGDDAEKGALVALRGQ